MTKQAQLCQHHCVPTDGVVVEPALQMLNTLRPDQIGLTVVQIFTEIWLKFWSKFYLLLFHPDNLIKSNLALD